MSRRSSRRAFRRSARRKTINTHRRPMRGGIRF